MINDLLDLSKIEAGRVELRLEPFQASDVLAEVLYTIAPLAAAKRILVDSYVPAHLSVCADRTRFRQIFLNLLSNAVKFTPERGRVTIKASREPRALRFSVADTGIGIPLEEQSGIFDEFRPGKAPKSVPAGAGLGLAITKRLVELHGGAIWVESEPAKGSRFTFTLAVEQAESAAGGLP